MQSHGHKTFPQICNIKGCCNEAEQIDTPFFSSGYYCKKHFDEINYEDDETNAVND